MTVRSITQAKPVGPESTAIVAQNRYGEKTMKGEGG